MILPILVTLPLGDAQDGSACPEERDRIQNKLIDEMLTEELLAEFAFYGSWYFYPYRNPNPRGQSLSPSQLSDVLRDELDFFLPSIESFAHLQSLYKNGSCTRIERRYQHPFVPPHTNKVTGETEVGEGSHLPWDSERIVLVLEAEERAKMNR